MTRLHYLIRRHLGPRNQRVTVVKSRHPGHVTELSTKAAREGYSLVVAVGGDGTVNRAAQGLLNSETALGVIPTGSGNGYAGNMGLPRRMDRALEVIKNPAFRSIDVGEVGENIFLVSCGIGWEAIIATVFEGSRIRGVLPYAGAALSTYLQYEPQMVELSAGPDGWTYQGRPLLFTVANMTDVGLGITIAPNAKPDDGLLDVSLIPRHSLLMDVKLTADMVLKRTESIPGFIGRKITSLVIKREFEGNIHVDGTPVPAGREIHIRVLPGALKVAVKGE